MFNILDVRFIIAVLKYWIYILRTQPHKKKIVLSFFEFSEPCPQDIKNCTELRQEYRRDVEQNSINGVCSGCVLSFIRQKYINKIVLSL